MKRAARINRPARMGSMIVDGVRLGGRADGRPPKSNRVTAATVTRHARLWRGTPSPIAASRLLAVLWDRGAVAPATAVDLNTLVEQTGLGVHDLEEISAALTVRRYAVRIRRGHFGENEGFYLAGADDVAREAQEYHDRAARITATAKDLDALAARLRAEAAQDARRAEQNLNLLAAEAEGCAEAGGNGHDRAA